MIVEVYVNYHHYDNRDLKILDILPFIVIYYLFITPAYIKIFFSDIIIMMIVIFEYIWICLCWRIRLI
jgi:hypothetical protein